MLAKRAATILTVSACVTGQLLGYAYKEQNSQQKHGHLREYVILRLQVPTDNFGKLPVFLHALLDERVSFNAHMTNQMLGDVISTHLLPQLTNQHPSLSCHILHLGLGNDGNRGRGEEGLPDMMNSQVKCTEQVYYNIYVHVSRGTSTMCRMQEIGHALSNKWAQIMIALEICGW